VVIGVFQEPGEALHLVGQDRLEVLGHVLPRRDLGVPGGQLGVGRDHPEFLLPGERLRPQRVPPASGTVLSRPVKVLSKNGDWQMRFQIRRRRIPLHHPQRMRWPGRWPIYIRTARKTSTSRQLSPGQFVLSLGTRPYFVLIPPGGERPAGVRGVRHGAMESDQHRDRMASTHSHPDQRMRLSCEITGQPGSCAARCRAGISGPDGHAGREGRDCRHRLQYC
jgi:hypothetical protein